VFFCVFFSYCIYVVLLLAQWGRPNGFEAWLMDFSNSFSALTLLVGSLTHKTRPRYDL